MSRLLTVGTPGHRVSVHVRRDRKNKLYYQWPRSEPSKGGARGGYEKVASAWVYPGKREARSIMKKKAAVVAEQIGLALKEGSSPEVIKALALGTELPEVMAPLPSGDGPQASPEMLANHVDSKALPLWRVMEAAIGKSARQVEPRAKLARMAHWRENPPSEIGIYQSWTQQARTARQLADQIEDVLGSATDLRSITANSARRLWTEGVADNAVKRVDVLLRVSRWAAREFRDSHDYRPLYLAAGWQSEVSEASRSTDDQIVEEPRYNQPELGRIWRVLKDPNSTVHPILRAATLLGGEQRLGQVLRTTVKGVASHHGTWLFKPPQQKKKLTSWIMVDLDQIEMFRSLNTAAQQRPDGRLFPLSRSAALTAWKELERLSNARALGWYAMRRAMTDLCTKAFGELMRETEDPLPNVDSLVLNAITGHRPVGEREGRYRDSPIGERHIPVPQSGKWDVVLSAMRVRRRARELAMEMADCPIF